MRPIRRCRPSGGSRTRSTFRSSRCSKGGEDGPFIEHLSRGATPIFVSDDGLCRLAVTGWLKTVDWLQWYDFQADPGGVLESSAHARGSVECLSVLEGELEVDVGGAIERGPRRRDAALPLRPAPPHPQSGRRAGARHDGQHPQGRDDRLSGGPRPAPQRTPYRTARRRSHNNINEKHLTGRRLFRSCFPLEPPPNRDMGPARQGRSTESMSAFHHEKVLSVHHWTDRLFSFRTTRAPSFRFRSGQFVMMGLEATASRCCAPIRWPAPTTTRRSNSSRSRSRTDR